LVHVVAPVILGVSDDWIATPLGSRYCTHAIACFVREIADEPEVHSCGPLAGKRPRCGRRKHRARFLHYGSQLARSPGTKLLAPEEKLSGDQK
jgi:hypothetical protein